MQLNELYKIVGESALSKVNVNAYFPDNPYTALQQKSVKYASVCFAVESVRDEEEMRTFTGILYYVDRLTNDGGNWMTVQDNAINTLWSIINDLRHTEGISDVEPVYTMELFRQRLSDYCGGAYVEINIQVPIDDCIEL